MDEAKIREWAFKVASQYTVNISRNEAILESAARELLAAEREACAKVCDGMKIKQAFKTNRVGAVESGWNDALYEAAKAIRKGAPHD